MEKVGLISLVFVYLYILIVHFVGDFVCQSRWMGDNKSKHIDALGAHVLVYYIVLWIGVLPFVLLFHAPGSVWVAWASINTVLHFFTDFCTSRLTSYFYKKKRMYAFWTTIGADQLIHELCLGITFLIVVQT